MRTVIPLSENSAQAYCDNKVINSRYTPLNFIFKNLYEQFRRPLNMYFLMVVCLQFISVIAPVNPLSTLLPLLFAFSMTALKEGYDDVKRQRQDYLYNNRAVTVLRNGSWKAIRSRDVRVGDILRVIKDDEIPADCVPLGSSVESMGIVYIRTDNMDGEIDLKPRDVLPLVISEVHGDCNPTMPLFDTTVDEQTILEKIKGFKFECPPPSALMDDFNGRVLCDGGAFMSFSNANLLPQSCILKNTSEVIALVVYTGQETKCGMNKCPQPNKWARIDQQVSCYSKVIFVFQIVSAITLGVAGFFASQGQVKKYWYLISPDDEGTMSSLFIYPLRFFLLTTVMIPISFKFVVDMSKYYMALVIEWDLSMYDEERQQGAKVKNSSIIEDLGQIEYIMADKTGTMTQNVMILKECSISSVVYEMRGKYSAIIKPIYQECVPGHRKGRGEEATEAKLVQFWEAIALCNSVDVTKGDLGDDNYIYSAVSPDEEALCNGAAANGVRLVGRCKNSATLKCSYSNNGIHLNNGTFEKKFIVHNTFTFTSERKCMSIIVEEVSTKKIYLLTKGADDKILSLLDSDFVRSKDGDELLKVTKRHLNLFASRGLRTLLVCYKNITQTDLEEFTRDYRMALISISDRQAKLDALRARMETDLTLVGATAIEDKLQNGVYSTIADLMCANVKIWMLTGDKVETAQQIGLSCGLISTEDNIINIYGCGWEEKLYAPVTGGFRKIKQRDISPSLREFKDRQRTHGSPNTIGDFFSHIPGVSKNRNVSQPHLQYGAATYEEEASTVLVVEGGPTLDRILSIPELRSRFTEIAMRCKSVICARVTPLQKSLVTGLVRNVGKLTLAIGDGGNDVAMIQEAHVGVGIVGREGQQAARAADFSVMQFSHLKTLMIVHGHQSYMRTGYIVHYSFYKSFLIGFIQLAFNITATLISGVSYWDSWSLTAWNGLYTLPPTLLFVFDRVVPRTVLEENPFLYKLPQRGYGMTKSSFSQAIIMGAVQSVATLWLIFNLMGEDYIDPFLGSTENWYIQFTVAYSALILLQIATVINESRSITLPNAITIFGMPVMYYLLSMAYSNVKVTDYYGVFMKTLNAPAILSALLICVILYIPHIVASTVRGVIWPNAAQALRRYEVERQASIGHATVLSKRHQKPRSCISHVILGIESIARRIVTPEEAAKLVAGSNGCQGLSTCGVLSDEEDL